MKTNITSRHFKASDSLQNYVNSKLEELGKYNENILHADVILSFEKETKCCEILIKLNDENIIAKETAEEYEKAIDLAIEKADAQMYKHKDKHKSQKHDTDKEIYKTI